jgi:PKD repeat protein
MTDTTYLRSAGALVLAALVALATVGGVASAAGATSLGVSATDQTFEVGGTTTVEVVLENAAGGVGAGQVGVELSDPAVADITDVSAGTNPGASTPSIAPDGSAASVYYAFDDTADTGAVTVLTVTLEGTAPGTSDLSVVSPAEAGGPDFELYFADEAGAAYSLTEVGSASLTVEEANEPPTVAIDGPTSVQAGTAANFGADASDDGTVTSYEWSFGDGADASGETVSHTYAATGTYDVSVTVTDDDGATATATQTVSVGAAPEPAAFAVSDLAAPGSAIAGETVNVSASVSNTGGQEGAETVSLALDGTAVASQSVTLAPGASTTVSFDLDTSGLAAGSHTYTVAAGDGEASGSLAVSDPAGEGTPATEVRLEPSDDLLAVGDSATYDIVVGNADGGVGAYDITVSLPNASAATIAGVETNGTAGDELTSVELAPDGTSVTVEAVLVDTPDTGEVTLGNVSLSGVADGATNLSVTVDELGTESGDAYEVTGTTGASVTVSSLVVGPSENPAADLDGDGDYEDVDGDGDVDVLDVQTLFAAREGATVTENPSAFDFNGDGQFGLLDIQTLYHDDVAP